MKTTNNERTFFEMLQSQVNIIVAQTTKDNANEQFQNMHNRIGKAKTIVDGWYYTKKELINTLIAELEKDKQTTAMVIFNEQMDELGELWGDQIKMLQDMFTNADTQIRNKQMQ